MDALGAWERMDKDAKETVLALYEDLARTESRSTLEKLRDIFREYGYGDGDQDELKRVLRRR